MLNIVTYPTTTCIDMDVTVNRMVQKCEANVDFGELVGLPLPKGFHLSTSFLFEVSICLSVLGSGAHMLATLGRPEYEDEESVQRLGELVE